MGLRTYQRLCDEMELSRSLLKFTERGGRASDPQFTAARGIATERPPSGRSILSPMVAPAVAAMVATTAHAARSSAIPAPRGGHERAQLAMALDAPETLGGAQQAEPEPAPPHVPIAPALDVPRDVPQGSDQILDAVRRREEAPRRRRQPQLQH